MGDYGRIQTLILANLQGHVVYERFYNTFTDLERADLRSAMQSAAAPILPNKKDGDEYVIRYRAGAAVFMTSNDLVFYMVGSGEYDELVLRESLVAVIRVVERIVGRDPTEASVWRDYGRVVLALDQAVHEGVLDNTDYDRVKSLLADARNRDD
mmetsp:Transcript_19140/g.57802  ORF Transcript_19140/g.57802 Transcript_19140/m.57802 type:complete len:154 (-) Transcript_19140:947-1408(-)